MSFLRPVLSFILLFVHPDSVTPCRLFSCYQLSGGHSCLNL